MGKRVLRTVKGWSGPRSRRCSGPPAERAHGPANHHKRGADNGGWGGHSARSAGRLYCCCSCAAAVDRASCVAARRYAGMRSSRLACGPAMEERCPDRSGGHIGSVGWQQRSQEGGRARHQLALLRCTSGQDRRAAACRRTPCCMRCGGGGGSCILPEGRGQHGRIAVPL